MYQKETNFFWPRTGELREKLLLLASYTSAPAFSTAKLNFPLTLTAVKKYYEKPYTSNH
jgi:hypothetical protein